MDAKGIAWVGHVYQKFEAMFLEVEEIMYEDTVKYVENQVQNVGASVKKFYSDVMDDLNPPSVLSDEKVDTSDLSDKQYSNVVICKKPSKGMEIRIGCPDDRTGKSTEKITVTGDVQKGKAYALSSASPKGSVKKPFIDPCSRRADGSISKQIDVSCKGSLEKRMPQAENPLEKTSIRESLRLGNSDETSLSIQDVNEDIENKKNVTTYVPLGCSSVLAYAVVNESEEMRLPSCGDSITEHDGIINRLVAEVASPLNEVDEVFVSHPGISDWWDLHEIESNADVDQEKRRVLQLHSTKLDGSCVVISKGDNPRFISHKEAKNRPYRKKIKEAFTSKKRLTRKQEYEHLAGKYRSNLEWGESLMGDVEVEAQNLGENDWELL